MHSVHERKGEGWAGLHVDPEPHSFSLRIQYADPDTDPEGRKFRKKLKKEICNLQFNIFG